MRKTLKNLLLLGLSLFFTATLILSIEGFASLWKKWEVTGAPLPFKEVNHCEYDPELGWRHANNRHVKDLYGPGIDLQTNGQHMRGRSDYPLDDDDQRYRILCLGDSFTMGYGVGDDDTFPALMAQQNERVETINMGLGGYGIDQCYLWHERDGGEFDVDALLFSFIIGDFYRMLPFGNVADMGKPQLELIDGEPVAINTPVFNLVEAPGVGTRLKRLWEHSELSSLLPKTLAAPSAAPATIAEQPFAPLALRIFERMRDQAKARDQLFVLALLPVFEEVAADRLPLVDDWLLPALKERGIPLLDLRPAFKRIPKDELLAHFALGHYSRRGNLVAAKALLEGIRKLDPDCPR
ncbi:MAG: hypothetical protein H6835_17410 [Planctomycetes bacterium]|nr:hypothetical protein [Planctomycetota bacterium]